MTARPISACGRMLCAAVIAGVMLQVPAAIGAEEPIPVWTLSPGQTFTAEITTSRATQIQIGDRVDESRSDDRVTVDYSLASYSDNDHLLMQLNPRSIERTTPDDSPQTANDVPAPDALAESANFDLIIDATGQVALAGTVASSEQAASTQAEIVRSWFDAPFRVPLRINNVLRRPPGRAKSEEPDDEEPDEEEEIAISTTTSRERPLRISLGPLGELSGTTRFIVEDIDDENGEIRFRIGGNVEHVAPPAQSELPLTVSGIEVERTDIEGHGTLLMNVDDPGLLKSLEMTIRMVIHGTGNVIIDGEPMSVSVRQDWEQTCEVSEIKMIGLSPGISIPFPQRNIP